MKRFIVFSILIYTAGILATQRCAKEATVDIADRQEPRSIIIWFPVDVGVSNKYGKCSEKTGKPLERSCMEISGKAQWLVKNKDSKYVDCTKIVSKCDDQPFKHYYRNDDNKLEKYHNKWHLLETEEVGELEKPCYLNTGLPLTRKCKYNPSNYEADWDVLNETFRNFICWKKPLSQRQQIEILNKNQNKFEESLLTLSQDVIENYNLYKRNPSTAINKALRFLGDDSAKLTAGHIKAVCDILEIILDQNENPELVPDIMNLTSSLMQTKADVIRKSNSSGEILSTIDAYFNNMAKHLVPTNKCEFINDGIYIQTVPMASLFFINPLCSNISGVAIYNSERSSGVKHLYDQHSRNYYNFIYLNQSLEKLLEETDLKTATYFPLQLWSSIINTSATRDKTVLKIMLFKNDALFVNQSLMDQKPVKSVLEISVIDYKGKLPSALPFIFNTIKPKRGEKPDCGYWNLSTWIKTGVNTSHISSSGNNQLLLCNTSHLTPFSALMNCNLLDSLDDSALDIISILGCCLSLFGLLCIWLTAACFPKWREISSNKVLLNVCFVLTLIMVFFLMLNMPAFNEPLLDVKTDVHCKIMGGFLQYIVLVLFMWMLFIAILQYQRLVVVYSSKMPSEYLTVFALSAWGLPLIPTGLVAYYQPDAYKIDALLIDDRGAICYPKGYGFYLGVMLPMAVIIIANMSIFTYIIYKLLQSNIVFKNQRTRQHFLRQIYVSILLFFLLGISWIFGMLAHLENSPVFSYLFCLTSTLQGFVIFIYFIIVNKTTRLTWWNFICGIKSSEIRSRRF